MSTSWASTSSATGPRSRPIAHPARRSRHGPSSRRSISWPCSSRLDPIDLRLKNAAKKGTKTAYGVTFNTIGMVETLEAIKNSAHYKTPVKHGYARGVAAGFWFNIGADSSAASHVGEDGSVTVISGNPDIGGSRASLALMAAEELGVDYNKVRPVIADTASIGFNFVTGGSRVTFATGLAVVNSVRDMIRELKVRAAKIWNVDPDGVIWENGMAKPAGANVGTFEPLTLADLAAQAGGPAGRSTAMPSSTSRARARASACMRRSQGRPTTPAASPSAATPRRRMSARHPSVLRRGPAPGRRRAGHRLGAERGVHLQRQGRLENPGFLDYRMPVASDLPMIETILVEVPNPHASLRRARRRRSADHSARSPPSATPSPAPSACAWSTCRCRRRGSPRRSRRRRRKWRRSKSRSAKGQN
jgi:Aerobic-type carbon monoxide dehydrogenase, large subunit CoxL/CutL homologs